MKAILLGVKWCLTVGLLCISLMTNGIEPLSITLSPRALSCFEIKMHDSSNLVLSQGGFACLEIPSDCMWIFEQFFFFLSSVYFKLLVIKFSFNPSLTFTLWRGWRGGLGVKGICCSYREPKFGSQHSLPAPPRTPDMHMVLRCRRAKQPYT